MSGNRENDEADLEMDPLDRRTRFQVNLVDANGKKDELENLCNG